MQHLAAVGGGIVERGRAVDTGEVRAREANSSAFDNKDEDGDTVATHEPAANGGACIRRERTVFIILRFVFADPFLTTFELHQDAALVFCIGSVYEEISECVFALLFIVRYRPLRFHLKP